MTTVTVEQRTQPVNLPVVEVVALGGAHIDDIAREFLDNMLAPLELPQYQDLTHSEASSFVIESSLSHRQGLLPPSNCTRAELTKFPMDIDLSVEERQQAMSIIYEQFRRIGMKIRSNKERSNYLQLVNFI